MQRGPIAIEENNAEYGHHVQLLDCSLERALFFFNNRVNLYDEYYAWFVMTLWNGEDVVCTARKELSKSVVVVRVGSPPRPR